MPDCGSDEISVISCKVKIRQVGLGLLGNACLTFAGSLDLIRTSWNVEDDILLRRVDCDTPTFRTMFFPRSFKISISFLCLVLTHYFF